MAEGKTIRGAKNEGAKRLAKYLCLLGVGLLLWFMVWIFLSSCSSQSYPMGGGVAYAPQPATAEDINELLNYREKSPKYKNISIDLNALAKEYNEVWMRDMPSSLMEISKKEVDPYDTGQIKSIMRYDLNDERLPEGVVNETIKWLKSDLNHILTETKRIEESLEAASKYDVLDKDIPKFDGYAQQLDDFYWELYHAIDVLDWENCTDVYTGEPADIGELCRFRILLWDKNASPAFLGSIAGGISYELDNWQHYIMD